MIMTANKKKTKTIYVITYLVYKVIWGRGGRFVDLQQVKAGEREDILKFLNIKVFRPRETKAQYKGVLDHLKGRYGLLNNVKIKHIKNDYIVIVLNEKEPKEIEIK